VTVPRTILCFGDSNTYGAVPTLARIGRHRFAPARRWTGILQRLLGPEWQVMEEGHPSRTTVFDDPIEGAHKNGLRALPVCLETHMPIDLVIIMLGTNDLKHRFGASPSDIADSIEVLVKAVQKSEAGPGGAAPAAMVIAPPPILEVGWMGELFAGGAAKSKQFGPRFREAAARCSAAFLDAGAIVESSTVDGIHLDEDAQRVLAGAVAERIGSLFGARTPAKRRTPGRRQTN
jgi:lysophospholipase L1-like esterase